MTIEFLEGLREEGALDGPWHGEATPVPARVRTVVQTRLSTLSQTAVYLVWVAAALGDSTDIRVIAGLMREPTAALLPYLDETVQSGLLVFQGQQLSFQCGLFRQTVLRTIPEPILVGLSSDVQTAVTPAQEQAAGDAVDVPLATDPLPTLTERQQVIARLVGSGLTNQQVANRMWLSPHTVNYHLRSIYRKLNIKSRVELVRHAS
jgi:DNA-binding CsgD family transcriptional regulator